MGWPYWFGGLRPRSLLSHLTLRSLAASLYSLGCRLKRLVRKMTPSWGEKSKETDTRGFPQWASPAEHPLSKQITKPHPSTQLPVSYLTSLTLQWADIQEWPLRKTSSKRGSSKQASGRKSTWRKPELCREERTSPKSALIFPDWQKNLLHPRNKNRKLLEKWGQNTELPPTQKRTLEIKSVMVEKQKKFDRQVRG